MNSVYDELKNLEPKNIEGQSELLGECPAQHSTIFKARNNSLLNRTIMGETSVLEEYNNLISYRGNGIRWLPKRKNPVFNQCVDELEKIIGPFDNNENMKTHFLPMDASVLTACTVVPGIALGFPAALGFASGNWGIAGFGMAMYGIMGVFGVLEWLSDSKPKYASHDRCQYVDDKVELARAHPNSSH